MGLKEFFAKMFGKEATSPQSKTEEMSNHSSSDNMGGGMDASEPKVSSDSMSDQEEKR